MLDWIKHFPDLWDESDEKEFLYSLDDAKERYEVVELTKNGYLVLKWDADKFWLHFAVLDFHHSDGDDKNVALCVQFYGEGPVGNLKECRHTHWGENGKGYLFYPNGELISEALKYLSQFYDEMPGSRSKFGQVNS